MVTSFKGMIWPLSHCCCRSGLLSQAFGLSSNLGVIEGFTWIPDLDRKTDENTCGYKKIDMLLVILIVHCGSNEASYSICHWFWYYLLSLCLNEFQRLWHMANDEKLLHGVVLSFPIISEDAYCFFNESHEHHYCWIGILMKSEGCFFFLNCWFLVVIT